MKARWLSTFTLIGFILVVLGIIGLAMHGRFVYDPGQTSDGNEPIYYLVVGILMIVNGLFTPPAVDDGSDESADKKQDTAAGSAPSGS